MTSDRAYARPVSPEQAMAELQRCAGHQFDPVTVEAFCAAAPRAARQRAEQSRPAAA